MDDLKTISKDIKAFIKPFEKLAKTCDEGPMASVLHKAIEAIPSSEAIVEATSRQTERLKELARELDNSEKSNFNKAWNQFCKQVEAIEKNPQKWQIGQIALQLNDDKSYAHFTYLDEKLTDPRFIQSESDLIEMHNAALNKIEIEEGKFTAEDIQKFMDKAYSNAIKKNEEYNTRVPVKELYHEFQLAMVEERLRNGQRTNFSDYIPVPMWVFKLRAHQYTKKANDENKIDWVTGSQKETANMGLLLGNPMHPEMKCWAVRRQANH